MADLFGRAEELQQLSPGDMRRGRIVAVSPERLIVEIGSDQRGVVPQEDLQRLPPEEVQALQEGQELYVYVTAVEDSPPRLELSLYLARQEYDWLRAEEIHRQQCCWEGRATGYNRGGLVVPFGHIRGFVPLSQITGLSRSIDREGIRSRLREMVDRTFAFKVIEVDRRQRRLVLSERMGRAARREAHQQQALTRLRKGTICRGRVRALVDYGAFVDLGGVVGLIHRTELAWFRVEHAEEILQEGQEVDVVVLRVNRKRGRVALSLKRSYPDPWPAAADRYDLGDLVEGRICRHSSGGLLVLLDDGVVGHLPWADVRQGDRSDEEFACGQRVLARVVRIDGARRRLGISVRRVRPQEWADWRKARGQEQPVFQDGEEAISSEEGPVPEGPGPLGVGQSGSPDLPVGDPSPEVTE